MRSYAVVVCGRLLGLLVPRLPAATSDSQRITMLEDATRRQEEEIRQKASSIGKAYLEYPETCVATAFIRSQELETLRAKNGGPSLEAK